MFFFLFLGVRLELKICKWFVLLLCLSTIRLIKCMQIAISDKVALIGVCVLLDEIVLSPFSRSGPREEVHHHIAPPQPGPEAFPDFYKC